MPSALVLRNEYAGNLCAQIFKRISAATDFGFKFVCKYNVQKYTYAAEALFKYRINNVTEILLVVFDVQNPKSQISEF